MAVTMRTTDESDDVQNATKAKCIVPRSKDAKGNVMAAYVYVHTRISFMVRMRCSS